MKHFLKYWIAYAALLILVIGAVWYFLINPSKKKNNLGGVSIGGFISNESARTSISTPINIPIDCNQLQLQIENAINKVNKSFLDWVNIYWATYNHNCFYDSPTHTTLLLKDVLNTYLLTPLKQDYPLGINGVNTNIVNGIGYGYIKLPTNADGSINCGNYSDAYNVALGAFLKDLNNYIPLRLLAIKNNCKTKIFN